MTLPLLEVSQLRKYFPVHGSFLERLLAKEELFVRAVDGIDFRIDRGDIFGLVGESGSGKTTTGRLTIRLLEPSHGSIRFNGREIFALEGEQLRLLRQKMQVIFQDPTAALNPRMRIGDAVSHPLRVHEIGSKEQQRSRTLEILEKVGLSPPEQFYNLYPHHLSGGQRQRIVIARALILRPEYVVADEPVAMVDVSMRAQIMELMLELKREFDLTYLFITHDLALARYMCTKIAIMYLGKIVEIGTRDEIFENPSHPYTQALLSAVPVPDPRARSVRTLPHGEIPSPIHPPPGCRFHPRCPYAMGVCSLEEPTMRWLGGQHYVACVLY